MVEWNNDDFVEGGLKGIKVFSGVLNDIEEGVTGQYGAQVRFDFTQVEIIESAEPLVLPNGTLSLWFKDSARVGSVKHKVTQDMIAFAKEKGVGPVPSCFKDTLMTWEVREYAYEGTGADGQPMAPGRGPVPIALDSEVMSTATRDTSNDEASTPDVATIEIPDAILTLINDGVDEDGSTGAMLRKIIGKPAAGKKLIKEHGLDDVLAALVATDVLYVDDGVFFKS